MGHAVRKPILLLANNKCLDQLAHPRNLINVFVILMAFKICLDRDRAIESISLKSYRVESSVAMESILFLTLAMLNIVLLSSPIIFSVSLEHSSCVQVFSIGEETLWILIRWLRQKPDEASWSGST